MGEQTDDEMLAELGLSAEREPRRTHTAEEERVIAGFEDILKFVEAHGHPPQHGEERDIFERLYAVRLDRLRDQPRFHKLLAPLDTGGLLTIREAGAAVGDLDDEDLLAELSIAADAPDDITILRNVARGGIMPADEVASRAPCPDFSTFKPLFDSVREDLRTGTREARKFERDASIKQGEFFILGGQLAYVASVPEELETEARSRAGSAARHLRQRHAERDPAPLVFSGPSYKPELDGRRITDPEIGPLFGSEAEDGDVVSGTIYVLQSRSGDPFIAANRDLVHKIGVTSGDVKARIAGAEKNPTYLLAGVEVVREYKLSGIRPRRLEALFHRLFAAARLDLALPDRFGEAGASA